MEIRHTNLFEKYLEWMPLTRIARPALKTLQRGWLVFLVQVLQCWHMQPLYRFQQRSSIAPLLRDQSVEKQGHNDLRACMGACLSLLDALLLGLATPLLCRCAAVFVSRAGNNNPESSCRPCSFKNHKQPCEGVTLVAELQEVEPGKRRVDLLFQAELMTVRLVSSMSRVLKLAVNHVYILYPGWACKGVSITPGVFERKGYSALVTFSLRHQDRFRSWNACGVLQTICELPESIHVVILFNARQPQSCNQTTHSNTVIAAQQLRHGVHAPCQNHKF